MNKRIKGQFTYDERRVLSILVEMIIPASDEYGVPDAGDEAIVNAILIDAERSSTRVVAALSALEDIAQSRNNIGFADLSADQRDDVVNAFRESQPANANLIAALTTQCYYRDDRVMVSLGMEPRPPHPDGYKVEQGDWSLLNPVRKRVEFYRKTK